MNASNLNSPSLILIFIFFAVSGCKTPEVRKVDNFETSLPLTSEVQYQLVNDFEPNSLNCIAVGEIEDNSGKGYAHLDKSRIVRSAVYGVLSSMNYRDIELNRVSFILSKKVNNVLRDLNCDALLYGSILAFKNSNLVAYSVTTVEIELSLKSLNGEILWKARHAANSHEGALPLSPISLLTGVFVASTNKEDEVAFQMVDAVARRTLATLPDRDEQGQSEILVAFSELDNPAHFVLKDDKPNSSDPESLLAQGAYEKALEEAEKGILAQLNEISNYVVAAKASLFLEKPVKASDFALKALAIDRENRQALSAAGYSFLKLDKLALAEGAFQKIVRLPEARSTDWHSLGLVQLARKEITPASDSFLNAGKLAIKNKKPEMLYYNLSKLNLLSKSNLMAKRNYFELGKLTESFLNRE